MSIILVLVLALGGASRAKHISYYDDEGAEEPMITRGQERRICAELCMAGLGGEPCGEECVDVMPRGLPRRSRPRQSSFDPHGDGSNRTRQSACPLLCANNLGYPLCACNGTLQQHRPFFRVDYAQICAYFCLVYEYQIFGCRKCDYFLDPNVTKPVGEVISIKEQDDDIDWVTWCKEMCREGEGGAACCCDLLPMKIAV